jgi:small subunit ribosomal protein S18
MTMQQRRRKPGGRRFFPRKKVCQFCVDKVQHIDYKDVPRIRRFVSEWGKIESRRKTGTCSPHQRMLSLAIKRARFLAFIPYTGSHSQIEMYRPEPRGDRRPRFDRNAPPSGDRDRDRDRERPGAPPSHERPAVPAATDRSESPSQERTSVAPVGAPSQATVVESPELTPAQKAQQAREKETGPTGELPTSAPAAPAPAMEVDPDKAPGADLDAPASREAAEEESEK